MKCIQEQIGEDEVKKCLENIPQLPDMGPLLRILRSSGLRKSRDNSRDLVHSSNCESRRTKTPTPIINTCSHSSLGAGLTCEACRWIYLTNCYHETTMFP